MRDADRGSGVEQIVQLASQRRRHHLLAAALLDLHCGGESAGLVLLLQLPQLLAAQLEGLNQTAQVNRRVFAQLEQDRVAGGLVRNVVRTDQQATHEHTASGTIDKHATLCGKVEILFRARRFRDCKSHPSHGCTTSGGRKKFTP
jgi:hypothetical protein